jgi:hypothetical protein
MKKSLRVSVVFNIVLFAIVCFGAYYKRDLIIRRAGIFYNAVFNKNYETDLSGYHERPYETDIKYINNNEYKRTLRIAVLGNSISLCPIIEGLWGHESGMAASDAERDYVHILLNRISREKECRIEYTVINIAGFERDFENFDPERLEGIRAFKPEIIIFQIGENVSSEMLMDKGEVFLEKYINLIKYCKGKETIVCMPFWPDKEKIKIITEAALKAGVYLADLSYLGSGIDELNMAKSEKKYKHIGVGEHPGDYGMENIAKILYIVILLINSQHK